MSWFLDTLFIISPWYQSSASCHCPAADLKEVKTIFPFWELIHIPGFEIAEFMLTWNVCSWLIPYCEGRRRYLGWNGWEYHYITRTGQKVSDFWWAKITKLLGSSEFSLPLRRKPVFILVDGHFGYKQMCISDLYCLSHFNFALWPALRALWNCTINFNLFAYLRVLLQREPFARVKLLKRTKGRIHLCFCFHLLSLQRWSGIHNTFLSALVWFSSPLAYSGLLSNLKPMVWKMLLMSMVKLPSLCFVTMSELSLCKM